MKTTTNTLKAAIEAKLATRTIEQLKNDAKASMKSDDYGANLIFVTATSLLESKLSESDYKAFEDSL